jgi:hypothetical protein
MLSPRRRRSIIGANAKPNHVVRSADLWGPPLGTSNACPTDAAPTLLSFKDVIELGAFVAMLRGADITTNS